MKNILTLMLALDVLTGAAQSIQYRNLNTNQFGSNNFSVSLKGGLLLTNPIVASGTITGNGTGLTNVSATNVVGALQVSTGDSRILVHSPNGDITLNDDLDLTTIGTDLLVNGTITGTGSGITGIPATNIFSGGQLPLGTVSTGLSAVAGPFLTTNGVARSYSYNASALTNFNASNLSSGTVADARMLLTQNLLSPVGTNVTIDFSTNRRVAVIAATNLYFPQPLNLASSVQGEIEIYQNSTGGWSVNWDTNYWEFQLNVVVAADTNASRRTKYFFSANYGATNLSIVPAPGFVK